MTASRLTTFRDQGFLVIERFVTPEACEALRERAAEIVEAFDEREHRAIFTTDQQARRTDDYFLDSAEAIHCFFEEHAFDAAGALRQPKARSINKIGHALHDLDARFDAFSRAPQVAALVAELELPAPRLMQSMYIFKQPRIGGEVRCHQDGTYLHTEPQRLLGLWFALEDATVENGCLWAIPGGHREGLRERFVRDGRRTRMEVLDVRAWREHELVPLELAQGGLIVLDGLVPHRSEVNRSARSRHAYTLHVVSGDDAYLESNWLRRETPARGF